MPDQPSPDAPQKLTLTHWLVVTIAALGFAFDIYELLMMPLIARPALAELLHVNPLTDSGDREIVKWTGYIMWGSAVSGGVFGLLGGYLTDRLGRRRVLAGSVCVYAFSPVIAAFSNSALMLLILRCTTFIGVCVEFVAAVAWLAELFPNPRQRETVLGYTQAFSSVGGLLVTGAYYLALHFVGPDLAWRYTLVSGMLPALPILLLYPFVPESPRWLEKRARGQLKRPSILELLQPAYRRTTLVTATLFACGYGAAFGAIQFTPQIVPGLVEGLPRLRQLRTDYEGAQAAKRQPSLVQAVSLVGGHAAASATPQLAIVPMTPQLVTATPEVLELREQKLQEQIEPLQKKQQQTVSGVNFWQELGGLAGRFFLAFLAVRMVSRRRLLWVFQVPGLLLIPLVFLLPGAGNCGDYSLDLLKVGIFVAGFLTVAQFSFWGNYLPRVYPVHLRGTGEGFAANVGGRMVGTAANPLTGLWVSLLPWAPSLFPSSRLAYSAAITVFLVYALGFAVSFWLQEPKQEELPD